MITKKHLRELGFIFTSKRDAVLVLPEFTVTLKHTVTSFVFFEDESYRLADLGYWLLKNKIDRKVKAIREKAEQVAWEKAHPTTFGGDGWLMHVRMSPQPIPYPWDLPTIFTTCIIA